MTTNHFRYILLLAALSLVLFSTTLSQKKFDVIVLKSGGKVVGTILDKRENQPVTIQLESGDKMTIQWDEIKSFDVVVVQEKSVDERVKEDSENNADIPWKLIYFSGNEVHPDQLLTVSDTSLLTLTNSKYTKIPIDSIAVVVHYKEGHFWTGAGIGFVAGAIMGGVIGASSISKQNPSNPTAPLTGLSEDGKVALGMVIGAPLGFFAGGIIGGTGEYVTYDLRAQKNPKMKRQILQEAIDN
jgi:hypothetical protein